MTKSNYINEIKNIDNSWSSEYLNELEVRDLETLLENVQFNSI